nr:MAG TPA: hypothetical protein [Caudoviricetes sp.]
MHRNVYNNSKNLAGVHEGDSPARIACGSRAG